MINDRYFPHDFGARHDPKILAVESVFGGLGYSFYFKLVEYLYSQGGEVELTKYSHETLVSELKAKASAEVKQFISVCLEDEIGLFYLREEKGRKFLRSKSLDRRFDKMKSKSEAAAKSASARWEGAKSKKGERPVKQAIAEDSFDMKVARIVFEDFAKPMGAATPNFQAWANQVRLLRESDKKAEDFIMKTLDAVRNHVGSGGFNWKDVIRSTQKLREQIRKGNISPDLKSKGASKPSAALSAADPSRFQFKEGAKK